MKFKEFLTKKGISQEQFEAMSSEEVAKLQSDYNEFLAKEYGDQVKSLKDDIAKAITKEDLDAVEKKLDNLLSKESEEYKKITDSIQKQGQALTELKERFGGKEDKELSIQEQIIKAIEGEKEAYEQLKASKGATMTFTIKAPASMLTTTNLTPAGNRIARTETEAGRVGFVRRNPFLLSLVNTGRTNAKVVYWVEMVNEDGTVAMTAEGAVKSQVDWDYVEASAEVKKLTAFTKVSKEMLDDVDNFAQDIQDELTERIALFLDGQILAGDGTGNNLEGIDANATAFAAGGLANTVDGANKLDALRAGVAQVYRSEFEPGVILLHPDDAASMDLQKGTDGHYLMPPFVTAGGQSVAGIPIVTNTGITVDDFYVADLSKFKVKIREDINIQIGYDSDDWTKNMVTPLAEMRAVAYIPANHYGAIVKGTFTAATAALETP